MDNNTRKYPRSMREAFGPYTSDQLDPIPEQFQKDDWIVLASCAAALVAVLAFVALGWV